MFSCLRLRFRLDTSDNRIRHLPGLRPEPNEVPESLLFLNCPAKGFDAEPCQREPRLKCRRHSGTAADSERVNLAREELNSLTKEKRR